MNHLHPTINFTFQQFNQHISFLDMMITLKQTLHNTVQKTHWLRGTSTLPFQLVTQVQRKHRFLANTQIQPPQHLQTSPPLRWHYFPRIHQGIRSRTVLPIVTPYSKEGKSFSQSVGDHLIHLHSHQAKPTFLHHKTKPKKISLKHFFFLISTANRTLSVSFFCATPQSSQVWNPIPSDTLAAKTHLKDVLKLSYEDTQDIFARCFLDS